MSHIIKNFSQKIISFYQTSSRAETVIEKPITLVLVALLFALIWYVPWFFDAFQIVRPHDNLDSEVVYNKLIGLYFKGGFHDEGLALNGAVPIFAFARLFQPLTLLYIFEDPWLAYALTDFIVRIVAFIGIFALFKELGLRSSISLISAIAFSTSITYTVHLLSVGGLPLVLWAGLVIHRMSASRSALILLMVFFIGMNTALALTGLFFIVLCLPFFIFSLGYSFHRSTLYCFVLYGVGLFLGNSGLIYAYFFSGIEWHRLEFYPSNPSLSFGSLMVFFKNLFFQFKWYHVTHPLFYIVLPSIITWNVCKPTLYAERRKFFAVFSFLVFIAVIYTLSKSEAGDFIRELVPVMRAFHWNKIYFLSSLVAFVLLALAFREARGKWYLFLVLCLFFQIFYNFSFHRPYHEVIKWVDGHAVGSKSFSKYYRTEDIRRVKEDMGGSLGPVLSIGFDPMIFPMNGIASIDGYYNMYPLYYKKAFRSVIEESMQAAGRNEYYDKWGSRVNAFHPRNKVNLINFCAAKHLGAKHVVSKRVINHTALKEIYRYSNSFIIYGYKDGKCRDIVPSDIELENEAKRKKTHKILLPQITSTQ